MSAPGRAQLHVLVVTYRRLDDLVVMFDALEAQTMPPDTITVVDNADDPEVAEAAGSRAGVVYVAAGANLGPAGALALGVQIIARSAGDRDLVAFVDDDDPPPDGDTLEVLMRLRSELEAAGERVGAVGCNGARFDRRFGALRRVGDDELDAFVPVDFIGGGCYPVYSLAALVDCGGPRTDLFFGFDDLELGLRLADHGYRLFASGEIWRSLRSRHGRFGLTPHQAAAGRRRTNWRRYYSVRNLIWVARRYGSVAAGPTATLRALMSAGADAVRQRTLRAANPAVRGVGDAWRGQLGRPVDPDEV